MRDTARRIAHGLERQDVRSLPQGPIHGDLFRDNLSRGTELGVLAKSYMDKGALVPDHVTISMVMDRLNRGAQQSEGGAILDGFPRGMTLSIFAVVSLAAARRFASMDSM